MEEETKDKANPSELEIRNDLETVLGEVVDFLDKRYPISMNLLRDIFGRERPKR